MDIDAKYQGRNVEATSRNAAPPSASLTQGVHPMQYLVALFTGRAAIYFGDDAHFDDAHFDDGGGGC